MPRVVLTDRFIAGARSNEAAQLEHFDANTPGLSIRVSSNARKTWNFHFTSPKNQKRARLTLGTYPATTLAAARGRAIEARGLLEDNRDPRDVLGTRGSGIMTVLDLFENYMRKHVIPNLRTARAVQRRFEKNVLPFLGNTRVADLHRRDINRVLDTVLARGKPIEAARCFEDIRALLRWARARGDLDHNPTEGMKKGAQSAARDRVLSDDEITSVWHALPAALPKSVSSQRILQLCLLTAQRIGEVAGMTRAELDLKKCLWTIPASRSKNKKSHKVPLSEAALHVIAAALDDSAGDFVFPADGGKRAVSPHGVAKNITRSQKRTDACPKGAFGVNGWSAHDFRRTAATGMAQIGIQPIVIGHVLNHLTVTKASVTFIHYAHYDYAPEKRRALELWADRVSGLVAGRCTAEIRPLQRST
jgi:integrase